MKKLLIENISENVTLLQKADFETVDMVFEALDCAFHPNGLDNEGPDTRFLALWTLFLSVTGWKEDDYWSELEFRSEHCKCTKCHEKEELEKKSSENSDTDKKLN